MKPAKKLLCVLLSLLLLFGASSSAFARIPEPVETGKCGTYAAYTLDLLTGTLRIYMTGGAKSAYMADYAKGESPFCGNPSIKTVEISPWICSIGAFAFENCENLTEVSVPFTVREIGAFAFAGSDKAVISYEGTSRDFEKVKVAEGNDWTADPERLIFTVKPLAEVSAVLPLPQPGDTVTLNVPLSVGDNEKYDACLLAVMTKERVLREGDVLEPEATYIFQIFFEPKEGYAVDEDTVARINDEAQPQTAGYVELSLTVPAVEVEPPKPETKSGTLQMLAYNVSGIPLIGDFQGSTFTLTNDRAAKLGALLNTTYVDFISVEEDFNGHKYLADAMSNYPYRSYTSGGVAQGQGLNVFSVHRLYNIDRVKWNCEYGTLSGSSDALSNKGFLYSLMELAPGVYVDVITVHCDAGYEPLSVKARSTNFTQLAEYINTKLTSGRALIVQGDFNFKFKRKLADDLVKNLLEPTGLTDVWAELSNGGLTDTDDPAFNFTTEGDDLDRVLYRSGSYMTLTPVSKTVPPLTGPNGERYTDHNPMLTVFDYTLSGTEPAPGTRVLPVEEDTFLLALKEVLWTVVRLVQAILGLTELPYLIWQGGELLINGKMA